jgi:hypothetical protein
VFNILADQERVVQAVPRHSCNPRRPEQSYKRLVRQGLIWYFALIFLSKNRATCTPTKATLLSSKE